MMDQTVKLSRIGSVARPRRTSRSTLYWLLVVACVLRLADSSRSQRLGSTSSKPAAASTSTASETEQPRIISQSGHLIFQTAENHNITFRSSSGGSIIFDGEDLRQLIHVVKENSRQIEELKTVEQSRVEQRLRLIEDQLISLRNSSSSQLAVLGRTIAQLTDRVAALEQELANNTNGRRLNRRISALSERVDELNRSVLTNECLSNPCQNGGTCLDQFNGFLCDCAAGWQGTTCETDVNECLTLQGTDIGCQHGATCINTPGSFRCLCTANYFGQRCTETHDDCANASNYALCGHGTCLNVPRREGQRGYRCMCDPGWTKEANQPACTVDVNECTAGRFPCSTDPQVICVNTPGSFVCGPCPAGFSGNGFTCVDINECLNDNGGCSRVPRVQCINTVGSYRCASCPAGFTGDGQTCTFVGVCSENNGGCHPLARCFESPLMLGRSCSCPRGYTGNGVGESGCVQAGGPCASNPCGNNGQCQESGSTYSCTCNPGWHGSQCQHQARGCSPNPCLNGGTCVTHVNGSFTCSCTPDYTGQLCQDVQQECGGTLLGEEGILAYPRNTSSTYPHSVTCIWQIRTSPSKALQLRFLNFKLETHPTCASDYLQIHDGATYGSRLIGHYCGVSIPRLINTTHNHAVIIFRSDATISSTGFRMMWSSITPTCGGRLVGEHGSVTSPAFPGVYPIQRDCYWTITAPVGRKLQLVFGMLEIEFSRNCSADFLEIRDGLPDNAPVLRRLCGSASTGSVGLPAPITTSTNAANIYFHSNEINVQRGFVITYTVIQSNCGGALTADRGVLISPDFPNAYPHDAVCIWTITVANRSAITFTFTDLDLEGHGNCRWDFVELRDGGDEEADFLGRFCGNSTPAAITSTSNKLWVKFQSDSSNRGSGFRAIYEVPCGGVFTDRNGTFTSPYFPRPYPNDKECIYLIRQPEGSTITLRFTIFDVESALTTPDNTCSSDYVEVRNGEMGDGPLIGRYCGSRAPAPIHSTGRSLWIKFKSDGSVSNHGFLARYSVSNTAGGGTQSGCGGVLTAPTGTISSPPHTDLYPNGVSCTWYITVQTGFIVSLTFSSFALEVHPLCATDYVQVYDSSTTSNSLGRFCGSNLPPTLTSTENVMTVVFTNDDNPVHERFLATYTAINASTGCGLTLRRPTGVIQSPNYPNNYPDSRQCEWTIVLPVGRQILLNFTDFSLEPTENCAYDYLEIRNGGFATSPLLGKFCTPIASAIRSHSNRLYLKFVSNNAVSARGFSLYYDGTTSGCGGELSGLTGSFVSPNYPLPYGQNAACVWTITVSRGSKVILEFVEIDMEQHPVCAFDYIEIRDTNSAGRSITQLCGNSTSATVQSFSNVMYVKFRTDSSQHGRGFYAKYRSSCGTLLTSHSGVIESPNFPYAYPANFNCSWVIRGTTGNTVNMSFTQFEVNTGSDPACGKDYVEVRDGPYPVSRLIGRYCGQTLPPAIASNDQSLFIRFATDGSLSANGFSLQYTVVGCGGHLTSATGEFTSPNYPDPYPNQRECLWTIEIDPGQRINLTIANFSMEHSANCSYDAFEVYGGMDDSSPLLLRLCDTIPHPQTTLSTGNIALVRFKSDVSNTGRGFRATYQAVAGGCGGVYTARSGTIMSANYPNAYPHNTDCLWQITVQPRHQVVLKFEDFELENATFCRYDYVAVYDSADFNNSVILRACGNSTPDAVRSSGNQLFIRMRSDGSRARRGFKATYETGCGGRISADDDGQIMSPGWPNTYPSLTNCTWLIEASNPADRVTLTFTYIDIETQDPNNCTRDYVKIFEGNEVSGPIVNTLCGTTVPAPVTSRGSALTVQFSSNQYGSNSGFQAHYTTSATACGGTFTAEHGQFMSPGYPDSYASNLDCSWTFSASLGNRITLAFSSFDLEDSSECQNDFVEIGVGEATEGVRYCGERAPVGNMTTGQTVWVKFHTNGDVTGRGFVASYSSLYGGDLVGNTGQLASPLYPGNYPHGVHYIWTVMADVGMRIRVTFLALDIEGSTRGFCRYDYIKLYDGQTAMELGTFCGSILPDPVTTTSNKLRILFSSDVSTNGQGFLLTWSAFAQGAVITSLPEGVTNAPAGRCGGLLVAGADDQMITSPGFPDQYANNVDCTWSIMSGDGDHIVVQFTNLSLEFSTGCSMDYVAIFEGNLNNLQRHKFCGRPAQLPDPIHLWSSTASIRFFTDVSITNRGFALVYRAACGGMLRQNAGTIRSPHHPQNYRPSTNCTWSLEVQSGKLIVLNFTALDTAGQPSDCGTGDYLEVFNGENTESPSLGKFCGSNQQLTRITSSSNRLTIQFVTNGDLQTGSGFQLHYEDVSIVCGQDVELNAERPTFEISSPNYPDSYPKDSDCAWTVTAPADRRVRIIFTGVFKIEQHPSCEFDYVEVRDGATVSSSLLERRFCGQTRPSKVVLSTGPVMFIRFRTDDSLGFSGFKAVLGFASCGGSVTGINGTLASPNYPALYANDIDCEWFVEAPRGHYLDLRFSALRLESNVNCSAGDFVEIRDGNSTGAVLALVCGSNIPSDVFTTSDSYAYVRFHTNAQFTDVGFELNFVASIEACGGTLTTDMGVIMSPNYPGNYAHRRACHWRIQVPESRKITLAFEDLDIENPFVHIMPTCAGDYVQVINGLLSQSPEIGRYCTRLTAPLTVESSGNAMAVNFRSNSGLIGRGFKATYTSDKPADCGFTFCPLTATVIESPGFSSNMSYNVSLQCVWVIKNCPHTQQQTTTVLRFTALDLEQHGECIYDFIEIREGDDENAPLLGRYCHLANQSLPVITSPSKSLWIRFVSDFSHAGRGFQLTSHIADCGGVMNEDHGVITNPNIAAGIIDCAWIIDGPIGSQIKLTYESLSLSADENCTDAYVEIINGIMPSAPSVGRECRAIHVGIFRTTRHQIRLRYHSETSNPALNQFRIRYDFMTQGCGGGIHAQHGLITSPNYPNPYNASVECIWDVVVANGYHVRWFFNDRFDVRSSTPCTEDYVEVGDLKDLAISNVQRMCGNTLPSGGSSQGNEFRVKFRSDQFGNGAGFSLNFSAECGAVYNATQGFIESPGYPDNYANNLNCTYDIIGNPQMHTIIRFTPGRFFILDNSRYNLMLPYQDRDLTVLLPGMEGRYAEPVLMGCNNDYIDVFTLGNRTEPPQKVRRLCGRVAPPVFSLVGGIRLNFVTDDTITDRGWHLQFKLADCGGRLTQPEGTIRSVLYPDSYHDNANCTWIITVPDNKIIRIKFEKMSLEPHSRCEFDYVAIYNGELIDPERLHGRFCGSVIPADVVSNGSTITVNFVTDSSHTGEGFIAHYSSHYGPAQGCGGIVNISAGESTSLRSPDIDGDGQYEDNLDCVWQVIAPQNYIIHAEFNRFDFEASSFSCVDYLEIHDGQLVTDAMIGTRFCSQSAIPRFNSSSSALYIRMFTDESAGGLGFLANLTALPSACGGLLHSRASDASLTYSPQGSLGRCRWIIDAPANEQIEINVTSLNVLEQDNCLKNHLELRDEPLTTAGQSVIACGQTPPNLFISTRNAVQVNFVTGEDTNIGARGFSLTYKILSCSRTLTSVASRIVSPRWPSSYPMNSNCVIKIITPPGHKLSIFFASVDIERHDSCAYDNLAVYNGTSTELTNRVAFLCGRVIPDPIFLDSNTATLKFVTDDSMTRSGYDITYIASPPDVCGGTLADINGTFTSPSYPNRASASLKCQWFINVPSQRIIHLQLYIVPVINATESAVCESSSVSVYDDSVEPHHLRGTFCTSDNIAVQTSTANKMFVTYTSNATATNVAFRVTYWSTYNTVVQQSPNTGTTDEDYSEFYDDTDD